MMFPLALPTRLLVSVRSASEASAALAGGADLIDVKEPTRGPMGRPDGRTINDVIAIVGKQKPVTAALGELHDLIGQPPSPSVCFCKIGLSTAGANWRNELDRASRQIGIARVVPVAYADRDNARSPEIGQVVRWAYDSGAPGVMIDTAVKDGRGLLDWLDLERLTAIIEHAQGLGLFVGVAGALNATTWPVAVAARPNLIGVRGAACDDGTRLSSISPAKIAEIKTSLAGLHAPQGTPVG